MKTSVIAVPTTLTFDPSLKGSGFTKRYFDCEIGWEKSGENIIYIMGDYLGWSDQVLTRARNNFKKVTFGPGKSVRIEEVDHLEKVPLTVLRTLSSQNKPWGVLSSISKIDYTMLVNISLPMCKSCKKEDLSNFFFLDKDEEGCILRKSSFYHGSLGWVSSWYRRTLSSSPLFRISSSIIYIEEENCFFLCGGYLPVSSLPNKNMELTRQEICFLTEKLFTQMDGGYLPMNDIWRYDIKSMKWQHLIPQSFPDFSPSNSCEKDPGYHILNTSYKLMSGFIPVFIGGAHHEKRRKLYYVGRTVGAPEGDDEYFLLFEYDYRNGSFDGLEQTLFKFRTGYYDYKFILSIIDYSNDTMILCLSRKGKFSLLIYCLETYRWLTLGLEKLNPRGVRKGYGVVNSWKMAFINNFENLVFVPSFSGEGINLDSEKKFKGGDIMVYTDWGKIRRKSIDPSLKKFRSVDPGSCKCGKKHL